MDTDATDIRPARIHAELKALRISDPDLDTRRREAARLRALARLCKGDPKTGRFATALYETARILRAPCREAARTAAGNS